MECGPHASQAAHLHALPATLPLAHAAAPCRPPRPPAAPFSFELEGRVKGTTQVVLTASGPGRTDPEDINQASSAGRGGAGRRCLARGAARGSLAPWCPPPLQRPAGAPCPTRAARGAHSAPATVCRCRSSLTLPLALWWARSTSSAPAPRTLWCAPLPADILAGSRSSVCRMRSIGLRRGSTWCLCACGAR